ncbi:MAG: hypothetical protein Q6356_010790 [Candidatus Wukongarchaeota archaeon]|nr:hypothetical protein [Candidatus Wukongarchaeota archaeon]
MYHLDIITALILSGITGVFFSWQMVGGRLRIEETLGKVEILEILHDLIYLALALSFIFIIFIPLEPDTKKFFLENIIKYEPGDFWIWNNEEMADSITRIILFFILIGWFYTWCIIGSYLGFRKKGILEPQEETKKDRQT